jgi:hypothetical protein
VIEGVTQGVESCRSRRPAGSLAAALLAFEAASFGTRQRWRCERWFGCRGRCGGGELAAGGVQLDGQVPGLFEGFVELGSEAVVVGGELLIRCRDPSPAAVFGGSFAAFPVQLDLQPVGFVFRCFKLFAEIPDHLPRSGEFVAFVEGLNERGWLLGAVGAGAPGSLAVGVGAPFAGSSAFAGNRHGITGVTLRDVCAHPWVIFCVGARELTIGTRIAAGCEAVVLAPLRCAAGCPQQRRKRWAVWSCVSVSTVSIPASWTATACKPATIAATAAVGSSPWS